MIDLSTDLGTDMSYPRTTSDRRPLSHQRNSSVGPRQIGNYQINNRQINNRRIDGNRANSSRGNRLDNSLGNRVSNRVSNPISDRPGSLNSPLRSVDSGRRLAQPSVSSRAPVVAFKWKKVFAKRAAWIGVGAIALSLLAVVPMRVDSESIDLSSCEKKIDPTGAISRGQLSALLALPTGANREAVRTVVDEPYCTLPAISNSAKGSAKRSSAKEKSAEESAIAGTYREAYPLAFDPEVWVVLAYTSGEDYAGYDFVFKP